MDRLEYLLHGFPASLQDYLVSVFSGGFRIHFVGERGAFESPNLKSALEQPLIVVSKLNNERDAGRIVGPFHEPSFPNFRCSPLGIVPKFLALPRLYLLFSFGDAGQSGAVAPLFNVPFLSRVPPAPWWGCHFFVACGETFNPTFPEEILIFALNLSFN